MREELFAVIPSNYNYLIGCFGTVIRLEHSIIAINGNRYKRSYSKRKSYLSDGYQKIEIKGDHYQIHRLIAQVFIPNPDRKPTVNHKDGNRSNNSIENLEWATYSENNQHSYDVLGKVGAFTGKHTALSKKVGKFKDGVLVQTFPSARSASIVHGKCTSYVSIAIKKDREADGYKWSFL